MKQYALAPSLALLLLIPLAGAAAADLQPAFGQVSAAPAETFPIPLTDESTQQVIGGLSTKAKCALAFAGLGVGLMAGAFATGGLALPAIGAAFAGNVAAICLL